MNILENCNLDLIGYQVTTNQFASATGISGKSLNLNKQRLGEYTGDVNAGAYHHAAISVHVKCNGPRMSIAGPGCDFHTIGHDDGPGCISKTDWGWCWCYGS